MQCEEVQQLLIDYLDNIIDPALREAIEKHLETCEKCQDEAGELQTILKSMDEALLEEPAEGLRKNFDAMLGSEIHKLQPDKNLHKGLMKKVGVIRLSSPLYKIAAGFALLVVGVVIGFKLKSGMKNSESGQLTELNKEVKEMKEVLMFTMLDEESASQRIQAVNYADEISNPNQKVVNALIQTLNTDKNVNVRLAAAYSLEKFSDSQLVRDSMVESLSRQTEPIIQVVLINILAEKKEIKAIKPMQEIISNKNTIKEVKDIAQKCVKIML